MKKGLIGCVNNPLNHINKIKVWANSFTNVSDGEVALVLINGTTEERVTLEYMGIKVFNYPTDDTETINNLRLRYEVDALLRLDWDYVMVTDVFDVKFQADPFDKVINGATELTFGHEGIYHNEEPWNLDVMQKSYPDKVELVRDKYIYCSGVMGGKRTAMIDLLNMMDTITYSGERGHDIRDQAALNMILYSNPIWNITGFTPRSGWVLHCALGGPTQFYEPWGFKNKFQDRWGEASIKDNMVVTGDGVPYDIVHQFNRIPEWNQILTYPYV